ncbi:MAG TPA: 2Fe-2S iron-sulfur cluster-binding protein, partial [Anaerolineae bacterium]|nr:2Fe-2S iron-sulfur cluster-binding protein [Anaerolineae bacterium]
MAAERARLQLTVNGVDYDLEVSPDAKLADVLRRSLGLTGTKIGCGEGQCGACVVLIEGRPMRSCTYPARRATGKQILTIEGLAASWGDPGELHPLQRAFIDHGALQCGFCTPGTLMSAAAFWSKMVASAPSDPISDEDLKHALRVNACRCTGYGGILRALRSAVHEFQTGEPLPPAELETVAPLRTIGRSYARTDAEAKVTGAAVFTDDITFPDMLHSRVLRAAYPHATILS